MVLSSNSPSQQSTAAAQTAVSSLAPGASAITSDPTEQSVSAVSQSPLPSGEATATSAGDPGAPSTQGIGGVVESLLGSSGGPAGTSSSGDPAGAILSILADPSTVTTPAQVDPTQYSAVATLGTHTVLAALSGAVVIGSSTLSSGGSMEIDQTLVTVGSNGIAVGSSTVALPTALSTSINDPYTADPSESVAIVAIGGSSFKVTAPSGSSAAYIAGQTLTPGQTAVISEQTVTYASNGIAIDGTIAPFAQATGHAPSDPTELQGAVFTVASQTYTAIQQSGTVVFSGQTAMPGEVVTEEGLTISVASTGLVVNGVSTAAFSQLNTDAITPLLAPPGHSGSSGAIVTIGS